MPSVQDILPYNIRVHTYIHTHVCTSVLCAAHVAEMYMCMYVCTYEVCLPTYLLDTRHCIRTYCTVTVCVPLILHYTTFLHHELT